MVRPAIQKYGVPQSETRNVQNALQSSVTSNDTEDSMLMAAEKWFQPVFDHGEHPYFPPHESSSKDTSITNDPASHPQDVDCHYFHQEAVASRDGSSAGDYRSVIDDLTIENRKLRERLRKYEYRHNTDLEQDKLFELNLHRGMPSEMMRELENTLQKFVSSIDAPEEQNPGLVVNTLTPRHPSNAPAAMQKISSSSTSNSRLQDSAYASLSASATTLTSTLNRSESEVCMDNSQLNHVQKIKKFLHHIPEGLLPKYASIMTERQKKKMVVKRLEQLFTGHVDSTFGDHSQPLQQQEISNAAALEQVAKNVRHSASPEGLREAHISTDMDSTPPSLRKNGSTDSSIDENLKLPRILSSPRQRPTRPLDLDPDRAQDPLDNVEYIRHLGLSTPQLIQASSGDAEPGAQGWIPLNLLIGMAQLHIINVTPNFVRSAVTDVSERFQLSSDGHLIRWRGGSEGTRLSSDSEGSEGRSHSSQDSDSHEESDMKSKVGRYTVRVQPQARFSSITHRTRVSSAVAPPQGQSFHYKPLFHRRNSDEESTASSGDIDSSAPYAPITGTGNLWQAQFRGQESRVGSSIKRRRDGGQIVFYRGAKFYTDLSGDRGDISTSHHLYTGAGRDREGMAQEVLGDTNSITPHELVRTPSGSLLPFRPFKEPSSGPRYLQTEETRPKTPELLSGTPDIDFIPGDSSPKLQPAQRLQQFDACGLGGTTPADHFVMKVTTRITKINGDTHPQLSKFSAPRLNARKYRHSIPRANLKVCRAPEQDITAATPASLGASSLLSPPLQGPQAPKPSLRREIVSSHFQNLEPSQLPPPFAYFSDESSSVEEEFDSEDSYTSISHLQNDPSMHPLFDFASSDPEEHSRVPVIEEPIVTDADEAEEQEYDSGMDEESDGSIDMLVHARQADPKMVAAQEEEFENGA